MPKIISISTHQPPYTLQQSNAEELTKELFYEKNPKIRTLSKGFRKMVELKHVIFCVPPEWHRTNHSFEERNNLYIELATQYSVSVIQACLQNEAFLHSPISPEEIDAIIFVSSTGISTPSIDARIMNKLTFFRSIKTYSIMGLRLCGRSSGC
ncbi:hypothetical protein OL548_02695 [Lysinibacillus sp. MHQ-1]|nr:hypothetical protein OL548_02695 [Lysinibacillus sp. MHQ-1]